MCTFDSFSVSATKTLHFKRFFFILAVVFGLDSFPLENETCWFFNYDGVHFFTICVGKILIKGNKLNCHIALQNAKISCGQMKCPENYKISILFLFVFPCYCGNCFFLFFLCEKFVGKSYIEAIRYGEYPY